MPQTYLVNIEPHLFIDGNCNIDEDGYISYRMVICHAIKDAITKGSSKEDIKNSISSLLNFENEDFDFPNLFRTCRNNPKIGDSKIVIVIDHSKGCYPLILHGKEASVVNGEIPLRIAGFQAALRDISNESHFDKLYELIDNNNFSESLHCKLEQLFEYSTNN